MKNLKKGFTLIETVVVMVVLGILMVATVVGASTYINKANTSNTKGDLRSFETVARQVLLENPDIKSTKEPADPTDAKLFIGGGEYDKYFIDDMVLSGATADAVKSEKVKDAWGQPYGVKFEGAGVDYDYQFTFTSGGKDKDLATAADNIVCTVSTKDSVITAKTIE